MKAVKKDKVKKELTSKQRSRNAMLRIILVSMLMAFIVFILLIVIKSDILDEEQRADVLVFSQDLPSGTKLTAEDIPSYMKISSRPISTLPEGAVSADDMSSIVDTFLSRSYVANEILTYKNVIDKTSHMGKVKNPIEISFSVSALADGVGGILREGDRVNIYAVTSNNGDAVSTLIMKKAYVTRVFDSSGSEISTSNSTSTATIISLIISEDVEGEFNAAIAKGTLRLSKVLEAESDDADNNEGDSQDEPDKPEENNEVPNTDDGIELYYDEYGRLTNIDGYLVNQNGEYVDTEGNLVNEPIYSGDVPVLPDESDEQSENE